MLWCGGPEQPICTAASLTDELSHLRCSMEVLCNWHAVVGALSNDLPHLRCSVEVLRDWRAMVGALTSDQANEARGDAATTNLVLLLSASVHRAVSAAPAGHRTDAK